MKIAIYAISKNEEQFVKRFCESAKEADMILIADTGSSDNTVELAKSCGADVYNICISPWRFDKARDAALSLIPRDIDICISLDLDEKLEPGWRQEIEKIWDNKTTRLGYYYDWGSGVVFFSDKIHARHGYTWKHPCHECLISDSRIDEIWAYSEKTLITHHPDPNKPRSQYLELLEVGVAENPNNSRDLLYYARELTYNNRWIDSILFFNKFLESSSPKCKYEECFATYNMAKSYENLNEPEKAQYFFERATQIAPDIRDPWIELGDFARRNNNWQLSYDSIVKALEITEKTFTYTMDSSSWGYKPYDIIALAAYYMGKYEDAVIYGELAYTNDPNNERLQQNLKLYREMTFVK